MPARSRCGPVGFHSLDSRVGHHVVDAGEISEREGAVGVRLDRFRHGPHWLAVIAHEQEHNTEPSPAPAVCIAMRLNQVLRSLVRLPLFTARRRAHARDRHRRQHGHLQRDRGRAAETAAVSAPGRARRARSRGAGRQPEARRRGAVPLLHLSRGRPRLSGRRRCWTDRHRQRHRPRASPRKSQRSSSPTACCRCSARTPMLGRLFTQTGRLAGGRETVMLTAGYWRSRFGGDPLGGRPALHARRPAARDHRRAARFVPVPRPEAVAVLPLRLDRSQGASSGSSATRRVARLKPGVTLAQANADVARLIPISLTRFPPFPGFSAEDVRGRAARAQPAAR